MWNFLLRKTVISPLPTKLLGSALILCNFTWRQRLFWNGNFSIRRCSRNSSLQRSSTTVNYSVFGDKLFREYINESLYAKDKGYFMDASRGPPLKETASPIPFQELTGPEQYYSLVAQRYAKQPNSWSTPVELFYPWYGYAIARWIEQVVQESFDRQQLFQEWHIVEVGGGNGSLAESILHYAKQNYSQRLYHSLKYDIIEISPLFVERQQRRLNAYSECVSIHSLSILDWSQTIRAPCILLFCEVLDNFPHDRIEWDSQTKTWYECLVRETEDISSNHPLNIVRVPLQDDWIVSTLHDWNMLDGLMPNISWRSLGGNPYYWLYYLQSMIDSLLFSSSRCVVYIPTVAHQMWTSVRRYFPQSHLLIADFDFLPQATRGFFAPVVQDGTKTFASIEEPIKASCDILFPVYFNGLSYAIRRLWNPKHIQIEKQSKFLEIYADLEYTRTQSGFNPILREEKKCLKKREWEWKNPSRDMFHKLKVGIKSVENTFSKHEASKDARFESAYQRFCELEDKASLLSNALRDNSKAWDQEPSKVLAKEALQCTEAYQEYLDKYGVTAVQESVRDNAVKLLNQYLERIRKLRAVSESQRKIMKEYDYYKDKVDSLRTAANTKEKERERLSRNESKLAEVRSRLEDCTNEFCKGVSQLEKQKNYVFDRALVTFLNAQFIALSYNPFYTIGQKLQDQYADMLSGEFEDLSMRDSLEVSAAT
ncbi:hypothetical protein Gasu2_34520 [Galdieria sulphuraria]|nr:hypothetical protein Gasu2_34520 [Galdieria sulphuraria]